MDEGYFLFYEETEWLWRARRRGARLGLAGGAHVHHHWGHSTARRADRGQIEAASRERFFGRNYPAGWRSVLRWVASGEGGAGAAGRTIGGPDELPVVSADLWVASTFRHLQPAVGAVGTSGLPELLTEVTRDGEWFVLAANRAGGRWMTVGAWQWNRG
jgi:hypothetical protein